MQHDGRIKRVTSAVDSTYRGYYARKLSPEEAVKRGLQELPPGQGWAVDMFGRVMRFCDLGYHP